MRIYIHVNSVLDTLFPEFGMQSQTLDKYRDDYQDLARAYNVSNNEGFYYICMM